MDFNKILKFAVAHQRSNFTLKWISWKIPIVRKIDEYRDSIHLFGNKSRENKWLFGFSFALVNKAPAGFVYLHPSIRIIYSTFWCEWFLHSIDESFWWLILIQRLKAKKDQNIPRTKIPCRFPFGLQFFFSVYLFNHSISLRLVQNSRCKKRNDNVRLQVLCPFSMEMNKAFWLK